VWPPKKISGLAQTSAILACNGKLFSPIFDQDRLRVPLSEIAEPVLTCVVATEDHRFFSHHGIDPIGLFRAAYVNIRALRILQGGSTITQQLARIAVLRRADRSFRRKLIEAITALFIEHCFSKQQILEHYLNAAYFGHSVFGIEQAALTHCGKRAADLDEVDAAYLVGLLKAPGRYCRCCNVARSEQRTRLVIRLAGLKEGCKGTGKVRKWLPR
jgi:penicillin-binding protein 1A